MYAELFKMQNEKLEYCEGRKKQYQLWKDDHRWSAIAQFQLSSGLREGKQVCPINKVAGLEHRGNRNYLRYKKTVPSKKRNEAMQQKTGPRNQVQDNRVWSRPGPNTPTDQATTPPLPKTGAVASCVFITGSIGRSSVGVA